MGQFTIAQLVENLARLSVPVGVIFLRLKRAEDVQGASREFRMDQNILQRDDETVASEWGDEPGKPGGGQKDDMIRTLDR